MSRSRLPFKEFSWTPELAYCIGLLVTDGNLSNDGRHIIMRSSDKEQLETFRSCLNVKAHIKETHHDGFAKNPAYRVQFGNVQFYNWLITIGIKPAKTYTLEKIEIPDKYFRDFLRGHLDGDGSITVYTDRYNTAKNPKYIYERLWIRFISASPKHIEWLVTTLRRLTEIKGHTFKTKIYRPDQTVPISGIKFGKKDSITLAKWMYYDTKVPCLKRKRKIVEAYLEKT